MTRERLAEIHREHARGDFDIPGDGTTRRTICELLDEVDRLRAALLDIGAGTEMREIHEVLR